MFLHLRPSLQAASGLLRPHLSALHFHPLLPRRTRSTSFNKHPHTLIPRSSATFHSKMADRTTWGEKAHLDLLLAVLNHVAIPNSDWDNKILPELRAKGYTFTLSAALYALST